MLVPKRTLTKDEQAEINGEVKFRRDKRRASKVTQATKNDILERDDYKCRRCGCEDSEANKLTIDHIVPVAMGGNKKHDNLQILCSNCNNWKGIRILDYRFL